MIPYNCILVLHETIKCIDSIINMYTCEMYNHVTNEYGKKRRYQFVVNGHNYTFVEYKDDAWSLMSKVIERNADKIGIKLLESHHTEHCIRCCIENTIPLVIKYKPSNAKDDDWFPNNLEGLQEYQIVFNKTLNDYLNGNR